MYTSHDRPIDLSSSSTRQSTLAAAVTASEHQGTGVRGDDFGYLPVTAGTACAVPNSGLRRPLAGLPVDVEVELARTLGYAVRQLHLQFDAAIQREQGFGVLRGETRDVGQRLIDWAER